MSMVSSTGSGAKTEDVLAAILKRLDAMDTKLKALDPLQEKVTALEESTDDMGSQAATLTAAVRRVDMAHSKLTEKITHVEMAQRQPASDRPPAVNRRRQGNDDDDQGGDTVLTAHKLEFPKFDGAGDPLPWLNRCERYFYVRRTSENKRVSLTTFYLLDDAQLWFHRLELNGGRPTWAQFVQLVNARFGPPLMDSPIGELALLCRQGTVDEFSKWFIALSCRDTTLTELQQVQLFITCLGDPLCTDVALQQPATLDNAVIFTRACE
jgi:hypothetical protein